MLMTQHLAFHKATLLNDVIILGTCFDLGNYYIYALLELLVIATVLNLTKLLEFKVQKENQEINHVSSIIASRFCANFLLYMINSQVDSREI